MNEYKRQIDYLDWEFGVFFHFGIRSFYPGHKDWDGIEMPSEGFNPDSLDCKQWIKIAKEAGATYAILTCKHHDGFAVWPSQYSKYSVANTPWKDGKGDVVREFVNACREYGLKVGLYYSPAQWGSHAIPFSSAREYDDYFINQIGELLTEYGKIDYLWFDGCGSEGHEYDHARIINAIAEMQPEILTFCDPEWSPGVRWIGNEDGYASLNNPLVVSKTDFSELSKEEQTLSQAMFLPSECDCKIRDTWFYDNNAETIKTVDELFGMYEASVGNGSNFLINIGPDNHGLLCKADSDRLLELGQRIRELYSSERNYSAPERDNNVYTIAHNEVNDSDWKIPKEERLVNCLSIKEDLTNGQAVSAFKIYAYLPYYKHKKVLVFEGRTIGHRKLCRIPAVRASKFEIEITEFDKPYEIKEIKAFFIK